MNKLLAPALTVLLLASTGSFAAPPIWEDVAAASIPLVGPRLIQPLKARTFAMDMDRLDAILRKAQPGNLDPAARPMLRLPMPKGGELRFRLADSPVMQPGLAARHPQIRTFVGSDVSNPAITGRFQIDPRGFRGMIFTPEGTVYIDPYSRGDRRHYQVYYTSDMPPKRRPADRVLPRAGAIGGAAKGFQLRAQKGASIANELRTYRLAMGATFEYSSYHDPKLPPAFPDKAVVLAEQVNVVNRVSGVYERDLGIRLVLVDGNEAAIYNTPVQPYVDAVGAAMIEINTTVLDENIGNENYDIGHVNSTGGGGIAGLGVVCNDLQKGAGVTGLFDPVGDAYYIDFVAHEMGHQFGANHTFNGSEATNCSPNRNASTAYEPGSGITIMAYAGVCSGQNLAPHSIDTFHGTSFDEIVEYTRSGEGNTCPAKTPIVNLPPVADAGVGGFTIPKQTPFELTGGSCDANSGDAITYQWEEFDLGPASAPNAAATTSGPIFRNFPPTPSPTRVFPKLGDLLNNTQTMGEILPNANRAMKFRLTVRDNNVFPSSGGVASDDLAFSVTTAAGPFLVTAPDTTITVLGRSTLTTTWNVAGTDAAPVSCSAVDVMLSTDGGLNFPTLLAAAVPNDGSQDVRLPNIGTAQARIKVKCAGSIFFDVSNANFTIDPVPDDTVPDVFTFADRIDVPLSTFVESAIVTPVGYDAQTTVTVTGGQYQIAGGGYTNSGSTIQPGQSLQVRMLSAGTVSTAREMQLTVGGVSVVFRAQTRGLFTLVDRTNVPTGQLITSQPVTIRGIAAPTTITISNGSYQFNRTGPFFTGSGTVNNGDTVRVQHTSSPNPNSTVDTVLTIGTESDTFSSTTAPSDTTPSAFTLTDQANVARGQLVTSQVITVKGINGPTPISVSNGSYQINRTGPFVTGGGTVNDYDVVRVQHTASANPSSTTNTVLTIGPVSDTFSSTTAPADTTPDAFTLTDQTNVNRGQLVSSQVITVKGINGPTPISVSNGSYQINRTGPFVTGSGTVNDYDVVRVQHTSSTFPGTTVDTLLTIGGVADTFSSTTAP